MMTSRKFNELYRKLNPAQREAVDQIDGPVMVLAGPGTGKTQVLTLRIANILRQTDTPPDAILALAFARSAAGAMRARLVEIVGAAAYRVKVHTFHSFCNEVIQTYPECFPRILGSTAASPIDQLRVLGEVIDQAKLKYLKPFGAPHFYLQPVRAAIDRLKKENVTPTALAKFNQTLEPGRTRDRNRELERLYRAYEATLAKRRLYDFNDMVVEVIRVMEREPEFRKILQEEHQYILADEQQDANQGQNELLRLLSDYDDRPNLFIVGDLKQAIFQFQGASLDNFDYFRRLYPAARAIALVDNYRSSQLILDAAHNLLAANSSLTKAALGPLKAQAVKETASEGKVAVRAFPSEEAEFAWLATDLKSRIKSLPEEAADRLAVIFRDNRDAQPLIEVFEREGIPFIVESETNVLNDWDIRKLLLIFRAIHHFGDDDYLAPLLLLDVFNLPPLEVWQLTSERRRSPSLYEEISRSGKFIKLYQQLERWHRLAANRSFAELFGVVIEESGFLPQLLEKSEALDKLEKLQSLFAELKNFSKSHPDFNLAQFVDYLDFLEAHHLPITLRSLPGRRGVRLLTAHKAKGLEFDHVYIVRAYDGHFGRRRSVNFFQLPLRGEGGLAEEIEAERRLFYVALTRGRYSVAVSYAEADDEGKHRLPSQFLTEIDKKLLRFLPGEELSLKPEEQIARSFKPRQQASVSLTDRAFVNQLFLARGLSPTALNNYLACPLKYFFNNLLRVSRAQGRELLYGQAIHEALNRFFNRYRERERVPLKYMVDSFKLALEREALSVPDRPILEAKGRRALTAYYRSYYPDWPRSLVNEFSVRGVLLEPELRLTGRIDKLEFIHPDGGEVNVVDYKTGRPKSRREILGQNKNATGDYFRQLVFYKLLLDRYVGAGGRRYEVTSGEIDFIEPDDKGRQKKERFALSSEAAENLTETIRRVAGEIRSLKMLERGCGQPTCEACTLWRLMGMG